MNEVTQKERDRIYDHAQVLVQTCGVDNPFVNDIAAVLMKTFSISKQRARNAAARGIRRERARLRQKRGAS